MQFSRPPNVKEILEVINLLQVIGDPSAFSSDLDRDDIFWDYNNGKGFTVDNAYVVLETNDFHIAYETSLKGFGDTYLLLSGGVFIRRGITYYMTMCLGILRRLLLRLSILV